MSPGANTRVYTHSQLSTNLSSATACFRITVIATPATTCFWIAVPTPAATTPAAAA